MVVSALLIGAGVAAVALLGGGAAGIRKWRKKRMQTKIMNKGEKEVAAEEKQGQEEIKRADEKAEKDIEKTTGEGKIKDKLLESSDEKEITQAAGTEQIEEELERDEKSEEKIEKETESEEKQVSKDIKKADKQASGGKKPKGTAKKEEKEEIKVTKEEAEEAKITEEIESTIFKDLEEALLLVSSLEVLGKDTQALALLEHRQQNKEESLSNKINQGLSAQLGKYASLNALNIYVINWMRDYFWPLVFREFEEKLYTTTYSQRLEEHLLPRVHAALRVAKASIDSLEHSRNKLDGLISKEYSNSKKAIKEIKKLISLKHKELKRVKKKAKSAQESQLITQLTREINIMSAYLSRMEAAQKRISETASFMRKNVLRIKAALAILQAYSVKIIRMEKQLEKITAKVKKKIHSVEKLVHESRVKIEELHVSTNSAEELIVEAAKVTKKFFEDYDEILEYIIKFDNDLKEIMNACFTMAYRERAVFFLLNALETAQDGILRAVAAIVGMSEAILSSKDIVKEDMNVFLSDLSKSEVLIQKGIRITSYLNKLSGQVLNQMISARQAINSEILFLQKVRAAVQNDGRLILDNINKVLAKLVQHMKRIDKNYISRFDTTTQQIKEFHSAAEQAQKARKLAA